MNTLTNRNSADCFKILTDNLKKNWVSFILSSFVLVLVASPTHAEKRLKKGLTLTDGKKKITLEIDEAKTDAERARGLMFRAKLAPLEGMLFDFESKQQISLWMKNVTIPLEAACFDEKGRLIETFLMEPCRVNPCTIYPSQSQEVRYLIEWTPGLLKRNGLSPGTTQIDLLTLR